MGGLLLGALAVAAGLWGASSIPLIGVTVAGVGLTGRRTRHLPE